MKQINYDAEHLYKDYMQSVSADPTAIEDILSGEREPANVGARIKHSTGKMVAITAAAAVMAVCTGVGLSALNSNDDSSIKPATSLTENSAQTGQNNEQSALPAETIAAAKFKSEMTQMYASDHGLIIKTKLTALNDEAKAVLRENDKLGGDNMYISVTADNNDSDFTKPSIHSERNDDSITATAAFFDFEDGITAIDGKTLNINFFLTSELSQHSQPPADRRLSVTVKKNMTERVFKSESGKTIWLTDFHLNSDFAPPTDADPVSYDFKLSFADGTSKSSSSPNMNSVSCISSSNKSWGTYFDENIDSKNVTSITFDGVEYKPQQGTIEVTADAVCVTDKAFVIEMKLTASDEQSKKLLADNIDHIQIKDINAVDPIILKYSIKNDGLEGNVLTIYYYGVCLEPVDETVTLELKNTSPLMTEKAVSNGGKVDIKLKKNAAEKVFVSTSGEQIRLSQRFATTDHMHADTPEKLHENYPEMIFKTSGGGQISSKDLHDDASANYSHKQVYHFWGAPKTIDIDKVTSITYDGIEFKPQ